LSAYTSFEIEDYVTQVGQGKIADRTAENLAESDAKVELLRRLWLKEVTALLEGRPLTDWKIPTEPLPVDRSETSDNPIFRQVAPAAE